METDVYQEIYHIEDTYWWYVGLRHLVLYYIDSYSREGDCIRLLDAGCGTGKLLEACGKVNAWGLDFADESINLAHERGLSRVIQGSVTSIPFIDRSFDIVVSTDVLYHLGVQDDRVALGEFHRVLRPGGRLILQVPAFDWLRGAHDIVVHTRKRYSLGEIVTKVEESGFRIEQSTYRNSFLFIPGVLKRLVYAHFQRKAAGPSSDLTPLPAWINKILTGVLVLENRLITRGVHFPFGVSVFISAERL